VDEFRQGPPVALIPLGITARRHHCAGDRASDSPEIDSTILFACVEVEGWSRTEPFAPQRSSREI
jgi:hypothetical protein